ncbi:MAG: glycosyltransferase family 87 protein [Rhizomicrobium sp.]
MIRGPAVPARLSPLALAAAGGIAFAYLAHLVMMLAAKSWIVDSSLHPIALDFLSFWSAGHLALTGHAGAAYDWPAMHMLQHQLMGHEPSGYYGWAYPPLFFCVAIILALMPYAMSFLVWAGATLALYAVAIARIAQDRGAALIACAAPATLACAMVGQNGFLSAALIAGILLQLETRPLLAGLLLGLLTYKPHFGLLFPIALICGGYWRVLLGATAATLAILVLSWLITPDSLTAFVGHLGNMSGNFLTEGSAGFYKQQSLYGLLRMLGVGDHTAFAAQSMLLLAMVAFVAWLWRSKRSLALKSAGLCTAALLATPYLYFYDFPILAVAIAFLWRTRAFSRGETLLLVASQLVMAAFMVVNAPTGFGGAILVLIVIARRLPDPQLKTALQSRPA